MKWVNDVTSEQAPDERLAAHFQAGHRESLDILARRHYQAVYAHVLRRVRDAETAQDITQEVFLRMTRALPRFRGDSRFKTWLYRITESACVDHFRRQSCRTIVPIDNWDEVESDAMTRSPSPCPLRFAVASELNGRIKGLMEELPPKQRRIFEMRHVEELKLNEIAEEIGRSLGTVKAHLFQARHKMREALASYAS